MTNGCNVNHYWQGGELGARQWDYRRQCRCLGVAVLQSRRRTDAAQLHTGANVVTVAAGFSTPTDTSTHCPLTHRPLCHWWLRELRLCNVLRRHLRECRDAHRLHFAAHSDCHRRWLDPGVGAPGSSHTPRISWNCHELPVNFHRIKTIYCF